MLLYWLYLAGEYYSEPTPQYNLYKTVFLYSIGLILCFLRFLLCFSMWCIPRWQRRLLNALILMLMSISHLKYHSEKKFSVGRLSKQLVLRLMDWITPNFSSLSRYYSFDSVCLDSIVSSYLWPKLLVSVDQTLKIRDIIVPILFGYVWQRFLS